MITTAAAARGPQVGQPGPDEFRGVARVEREGRGEIVVPGTGEVAAADRAARIGDQVIEAAEHGRDVVHGAPQLGRVGDVGHRGGDEDASGSQPLGGGGQPGRVPGDETHGRSLGGERLGHREADAPASPGDQHALVAQAKIHDWLLSVRQDSFPDSKRRRYRENGRLWVIT